MACSLIQHKRIKTTLAKAKSLRVYVEPLITKSKNDTTHNRRVCFSYLRQKSAIKELFSVVSDKVAERPGGYTRIIKLGNRLGDAAEICFIELVDFNEVYNADITKKKRTRRSKKPDTIEDKSKVVEDAVVLEETKTNSEASQTKDSAPSVNSDTSKSKDSTPDAQTEDTPD
jgi:large subunit ribosomal protein L17